MKKLLVVLIAVASAGCSTIATDSLLKTVSTVRDNEAEVRYSAFCATAANAALRKFRSQRDRDAFIQLCDTDAAK